MFFYLFLFSVIGAAVMFLITWNKQRKDFKPVNEIPTYAIAIVIGGLISYFIDKKEVLALAVFFAQVAMVYFIDWLMKVGKK